MEGLRTETAVLTVTEALETIAADVTTHPLHVRVGIETEIEIATETLDVIEKVVIMIEMDIGTGTKIGIEIEDITEILAMIETTETEMDVITEIRDVIESVDAIEMDVIMIEKEILSIETEIDTERSVRGEASELFTSFELYQDDLLSLFASKRNKRCIITLFYIIVLRRSKRKYVN